MIPHSALATRFLVAALALFACTGCPDDGGRDYGSIKIFIQPRNFGPFTTTDFEANASLKTPAGQPATFFFSWERDGMPTGNDTRFVDSDDTTKNQVWTVTVTAQAGGRDFGPETLDVPILNSPPTATLRVLPVGFQECDDITLEITNLMDADGDAPITIVLIEWFVNNVMVASGPAATMLDESFFGDRDSIRVEVTLNDTQADAIVVANATPFVPRPDAPPGVDRCPPMMPISVGSRDGSVQTFSVPELQASGPARATSGASSVLQAPRSLAISSSHVCSLGAGGALACSGPEDSALAEVPEGSYALVATGPDYACAIGAEDGAVACWGDAPVESGLLEPPDGSFVALALGLERACGLLATGAPACWGLPLAEGERLPAGPFEGLDVADDDYFCAIDAAGAVSCWGGQ